MFCAGSSLPSKCPDRPPASALLLCAPSRLLGVPFTWMGKAGSCGSGWQGGTLAVTYKRVSGSELETVSALKEITALSWGCVVWRGGARVGNADLCPSRTCDVPLDGVYLYGVY